MHTSSVGSTKASAVPEPPFAAVLACKRLTSSRLLPDAEAAAPARLRTLAGSENAIR